MLKSYEALCEHGRIRWLETPPDVALARVIVTVLAEPKVEPGTPLHPEKSVDALLSRTAGAWGKRSPPELADLLSAQREADWGPDA